MNEQFRDAVMFKFNQLNRMSKNPIVFKEDSIKSQFGELINKKDPLVINAIKYAMGLGLEPLDS